VSDIGNPFLLGSILDKVDSALGDAIAVIEREGQSMSAQGEGDPVLARFRQWREEVDGMRHGSLRGSSSPAGSRSRERAPAREGGLYTD
jgi:hypothetical protein